ncbi:MAG: TIGR03545 family protein [Elusimicrobia bacterium]|nr:TIGR03545 family protein [Elusimicrobiota bacterium]
MIRWSALGARLAVVAVIWAFFALAFDPLLKRGIERAGSAALGAKLELGSFKTRFFPPSVRVARLAAADAEDPMRDLVVVGAARFELEGRPLLEKKLVVSAATLEGLAFGTPRKSSGALPSAPPSPAAEALGRWSQEAKAAVAGAGESAKDDLTARYKVDPEALASVKLARELEARWNASYEDWDTRLKAFDVQRKVAEIEALAAKAKAGAPAERVAAALEVSKKVKEARAELQAIEQGLRAAAARAKADLGAVARAKESDLQAAAALLKLPVFDAETVTGYLVGPRVAAWVSRAARLAAASRGGAPEAKPLARGTEVPFPKARSWPRFWVKKAVLSGVIDLGGPLEFKGEAADWASEAALVPGPARLHLAGAQGDRSVSATVALDRRGPEPAASLEARVAGLAFAAQSFGEGSFAVEAGPGRADAAARLGFSGGALLGDFAVKAVPSSLSARGAGANPLVVRALGEALASLKTIEVKGAVAGTPDAPRLSLSSNLGRATGDALKRVAGREAEERLAGVRAKIDAAVKEKVGPLSERIDGQAKGLLDAAGLGDRRLKELLGKATGPMKLPAGLPQLKGLFK